MNFSVSDQALLQRWQHLSVREKSESDLAARCDLLRSLIGQLQYVRDANILPADTVHPLYDELAQEYSLVVDAPKDAAGLDNYAEGALAIAEGKKNESKLWSTSLTNENVMELDCVKKFLSDAKLARNMHFPENKENEILPCTNRQPKSQYAKPLFKPSSPMKVQPPMQSANAPTAHPNTVAQMTNGSGQPPHHMTAGSGKAAMHNPVNTAQQSSNTNIQSTSNSATNSLFSSIKQPVATSSTLFKPASMNQRDLVNMYNDNRGNQQASRQPDQSDGKNFPQSVFNSGRQQENSTGAQCNFASDRSSSLYKKPQKRRCVDEEDEIQDDITPHVNAFRTAAQQLAINNQKKYGSGRGGRQMNSGTSASISTSSYGGQKRSLGTRRGLNSKFIPPVLREDGDDSPTMTGQKRKPTSSSSRDGDGMSDEPVDERLKNIEPKMIELINSEIMDHGPEVAWEDIAGLEFAKKTIKEIVVWPMLRPDIFTGLRGPPKGLLLFGPPGTGKTLIGKCIASQSKSTFFSISASSLTSKWVGEGEKMVRALFAVARVQQPSVVFIDEIDSLLSQRSNDENEGSRRIKTEFLVQLDGAGTATEDRILVVGATNRPQEIDEAARRRFVKRLYIPLPEIAARRQIVINLMKTMKNGLNDKHVDKISSNTDGYSGADMANLCREAALGPIRSVPFEQIENITPDQVRPISFTDFEEAIEHVRPSVSDKDLDAYLDWNKQYGSWGR